MGRIEDYALIGDGHTAALVGRDGSIDWLCLPRFDSGACFAALLGDEKHGRWKIAPAEPVVAVRRRYRKDTLVLETEMETEHGVIVLVDFMPPRAETPELVRLVEGKAGEVRVKSELVVRFDYGAVIPWVTHDDEGFHAIAGPDALRIRGGIRMRGRDFATHGEVTLRPGERIAFELEWFPSFRPQPAPIDPLRRLAETETFFREWAGRCTYEGRHREAVVRSLLTLKALIYAPTGGIVAAPTTSLPEEIGGMRNWDYRICWVRDATFTLYALLLAGFVDEAREWREWLLRAVAGTPSEVQIMYGLAGERRLTEREVPWLPGYCNSRPVRVGNAAFAQLQLDIHGEVMDAMHQARRAGVPTDAHSWAVQRAILKALENQWTEPDEGIWEVRGPRRHFTHSKVMAWVAFDRAVKAVERFGQPGPVERWRGLRDTIFREVCREGWNPQLGAFVQSYGSDRLDASLLMMPLVGFLPPHDPRMRSTVEAIERGLMHHGLLRRYTPDVHLDGLPGGEGVFLACSFWLVDNLVLLGRTVDAERLFDQLLALRNDVGLLSEEWDPVERRQLGNFPQAFSHIGLVNSALNLRGHPGPATHRKNS